MKGYMYILQCSDDSYYVGSTIDLNMRFEQHQCGEGANYTKKRLPVKLLYYEEFDRIDGAFYREKEVQGWSRKKKEALMEHNFSALHLLAECKNQSHYKLNWLSSNCQVLGNKELIKQNTTAFLCSREIPESAVQKCYNWVIAQKESGNCVISGFHSKIEKEVLRCLLQGNRPIIVALARGLKDKIEPQLQQAINEGRMLIVTPFAKEVKRATEKTAEARNWLMIELADEIAVGYVNPDGKLLKVLNSFKAGKTITFINKL